MTSPDESSIGKRVWSGPAANPLPAGSLTSSVVFGWKLDDSPPSSFWFLRCPYIMLINAASLFAESFLLFAGAFLTLSFVALAGAETPPALAVVACAACDAVCAAVLEVPPTCDDTAAVAWAFAAAT